MAFIYADPNTAGPFITFQVKDVTTKVFKLGSANFNTTPVNTLVGVLPADSSIIRISQWVKTQLAGGSVSAATFKLGASSAGSDFVNGVSMFGTAGTYSVVTPVTGILQPYNPPMTTDIQLWVQGTATTGNPTSGEIYLIVEYVR
jgi:hypothetical protein